MGDASLSDDPRATRLPLTEFPANIPPNVSQPENGFNDQFSWHVVWCLSVVFGHSGLGWANKSCTNDSLEGRESRVVWFHIQFLQALVPSVR